MNHLLDTTDLSASSLDTLHRAANVLTSFGDVVPLLQELNLRTETILDFLEQPQYLRLSQWPPGFLRGLAINRVCLPDSIDFLCAQHLDVDKAWKNAEALQKLSCSKRCKPLIKKLVLHVKKERLTWEKMLREFEVSVLRVEQGDEFDPVIHSAVDTITVDDVDLIGTIEEAHTACYRWRDENGVDQVREAEITLRTEA